MIMVKLRQDEFGECFVLSGSESFIPCILSRNLTESEMADIRVMRIFGSIGRK
jgi:hypothetical protein